MLNEATGELEWHAVKSTTLSGAVINMFGVGGGGGTGGSSSGRSSAIALRDVTEVCRGIQTDVMMKARLVDPLCSLSIVTADRTLDMTLKSPVERDALIRTLHVIFADQKDAVKFR